MRMLRPVAEGVLEACCLAALVLIPLTLDRHAASVFEPPKAYLLQAIAVVALVAWALAWLADPARARPSGQRLLRSLRNPVVAASALLLVSHVLATACSIAPSDSLWGHPGRAAGSLSLLAQLTLFATCAARLSAPGFSQRLLSALILPSLPIALYALAQRLGYEALPLTVRETEMSRSLSLFGAPVFLGAYLDLVLPFTLLRVFQHAQQAVSRRRKLLACGCYLALVLLQVAALLVSESRGAILALIVGGGLALLCVAALRGARRPVLALWALGCVGAIAIALGAPAKLAKLSAGGEYARVAQRAADAFAVSSSGGSFRALTWGVAERALRRSQPLEFADGSHDALPALRSVLGYGPDTQASLAPPAYDAAMPRLFGYPLIDRFHNEQWDELLTTGVLGLGAWLALQSALLWLVVASLKLAATRRRATLFWLAYAAGGLGGALGWSALHGAAFAFLGLQLGGALGLALFLSAAVWWQTPAASSPREGLPHSAIMIAALSAIVAHLLEASFSFKVMASGLLFWIVSALVLACARQVTGAGDARTGDVALGNDASERADLAQHGDVAERKDVAQRTGVAKHANVATHADVAKRAGVAKHANVATHADVAQGRDAFASDPAQRDGRSESGSALLRAIPEASLLAWMLLALGSAFIGASGGSSDAGVLLWDSFTRVSQPPGARAPIVALVMAAALAGGALLLLIERDPRASSWPAHARAMLGLVLALTLPAWIWFAVIEAQLAGASGSPEALVSSNLGARNHACTAFYLSCALIMALFAAARVGSAAVGRAPVSPARKGRRSPIASPPALGPARTLGAVAASLLGLLAIERVALRPAHADQALALGAQLELGDQPQSAPLAHRQAVAMLPGRGVYRTALAKAYARLADRDPAQADAWGQQADRELRAAIALDPAATENAVHLAQFNAQRAERASPAQRAALLPEVSSLYARALRLHPQSAPVWRLWAKAQLALLNDPAAALSSALRIPAVDANTPANLAFLGTCHVLLARTQQGTAHRKHTLAGASAFEEAGKLAPNNASYFTNAAVLYLDEGLPNRAAGPLRAAIAALPASAPERPRLLELLQQAQAQIALADRSAAPP